MKEGFAFPQSDFVLGDTFKDLAILQAKAHNLTSICGQNLHFDNFAWIADVISRNKGLIKVYLEKSNDPKKDGKRQNLRYVDCNWLTDCQNLRDFMIHDYKNENLAKLPPSLTDLTLFSLVTLENMVWMAENQQKLRNCIIALREEVADESLLRNMAEIGKPKNAYELLGLSAPTAEGAPTATNDKPMLTPELLRRFINLPHMEILWVMFLVTKNPANSDNQPTDYDHMAKQVTQVKDRFQDLNEVCKKTAGFKEVI
ncbi:uncharacterized protein LOC118433059 [Folsomia candida]|uniref:uncharacterized protein LOC118433059 n=1 Tax=Folsomia candida TaxID=158441 RepID=UPI0016050FC8|nr:uncharacterized protein LOC118433059 [Folsomia candida]